MPIFEQSLNCGDCVNTTIEAAGNFKVNLQSYPYKHSPTNSTFDIGVQPESGFMNYMAKEATYVMLLEYYTNSSQALQPASMQPFPYPTLVPLIGIHIPIYDLSQQIQANPVAFLNTLGFISDNSTKVQNITLSMIILASFFVLAALIAFCVVKVKKGQ